VLVQVHLLDQVPGSVVAEEADAAVAVLPAGDPVPFVIGEPGAVRTVFRNPDQLVEPVVGEAVGDRRGACRDLPLGDVAVFVVRVVRSVAVRFGDGFQLVVGVVGIGGDFIVRVVRLLRHVPIGIVFEGIPFGAIVGDGGLAVDGVVAGFHRVSVGIGHLRLVPIDIVIESGGFVQRVGDAFHLVQFVVGVDGRLVFGVDHLRLVAVGIVLVLGDTVLRVGHLGEAIQPVVGEGGGVRRLFLAGHVADGVIGVFDDPARGIGGLRPIVSVGIVLVPRCDRSRDHLMRCRSVALVRCWRGGIGGLPIM